MSVAIYKRGSDTKLTECKLGASTQFVDIKRAVCEKKRGLYPERVALYIENKEKAGAYVRVDLDAKQSVKDACSSGKIFFKDLGPQIGWNTVFFWEYFGPLCIFAATFFFRNAIWGTDIPEASDVQRLAMYCWVGHYAKRILETFFVHVHAQSTMPLFNLFKNCSYYWGFAALVAYFVCHPQYAAPAELNVKAGLYLFIGSELCNGWTHLTLANIRRKNPKAYEIPTGPLFALLSCPNYFFETMAWFGFNIMTQSFFGYMFMLAGFLQMLEWALARHRKYRKTFKNYPRIRKAIIPFVI